MQKFLSRYILEKIGPRCPRAPPGDLQSEKSAAELLNDTSSLSADVLRSELGKDGAIGWNHKVLDDLGPQLSRLRAK